MAEKEGGTPPPSHIAVRSVTRIVIRDFDFEARGLRSPGEAAVMALADAIATRLIEGGLIVTWDAGQGYEPQRAPVPRSRAAAGSWCPPGPPCRGAVREPRLNRHHRRAATPAQAGGDNTAQSTGKA